MSRRCWMSVDGYCAIDGYGFMQKGVRATTTRKVVITRSSLRSISNRLAAMADNIFFTEKNKNSLIADQIAIEDQIYISDDMIKHPKRHESPWYGRKVLADRAFLHGIKRRIEKVEHNKGMLLRASSKKILLEVSEEIDRFLSSTRVRSK